MCDDPKELGSSQAPWGIPKDEPASSRGGGSGLPTSGSVNPGGAGGSHLHAMVIPELPASLGSEASSRGLGAPVQRLATLPGAVGLHLGIQSLPQGLGRLWSPPP